jgi:hypothetical protein
MQSVASLVHSFDLSAVESHHSERELNIVHAELWSYLVRDDSGNCSDCVLMFRRSYCVNPSHFGNVFPGFVCDMNLKPTCRGGMYEKFPRC